MSKKLLTILLTSISLFVFASQGVSTNPAPAQISNSGETNQHNNQGSNNSHISSGSEISTGISSPREEAQPPIKYNENGAQTSHEPDMIPNIATEGEDGQPADNNKDDSQISQNSNTILDFKTTHGSVLIKKIPQKPKAQKAKISGDIQLPPSDSSTLQFKVKTNDAAVGDPNKNSASALPESDNKLKP